MDKLRVGLLVNSPQVPAWTHHMLTRIAASDYAEVALIVENDLEGLRRTGAPSMRHVFHRAGRRPLLALQNWLMRPDRPKPPAFEMRPLGELFPDVPVLTVTPRRRRVSDYFRKEDLETIRGHDLDVLIRLGFRILRGGILTVARYGVWSFHHGDNLVNRGGPAGYWETMESWPTTGSVLQILTEDLDNGKVLARSWSSTIGVSWPQNKNRVYWKTSALLPRKLEELHRQGPDAFWARVERDNVRPALYSNPLFRSPTNPELVRHLVTKIKQRITGRIRQKFFYDQWFLMYDLGPEISSSFWRYKKIIPPKNRFWADPHFVARDGKYYIYFEDAVYEPRKLGHISLIVMDEKGNWEPPVTVLKRPYHLSYPFLFEWRGTLYMIPETMENRAIEVYRCTRFPDRWEFEKNLMENVAAVDATLFEHGDRWWMFTNMVETLGASSWDELFLFSAEHPLADRWEPHPQNPIVSDVRRSRPAGKIFEHRGRIYRPSQDCSRAYGYGFNLSEILTLNETEYVEDTFCRVEPNWERNLTGTHTFNHGEGLTIIDGKTRRRR